MMLMMSQENRESAKSIILVTGIATSVMVTLILLLLIFKAENSLQASKFFRKKAYK